MPYITQDGRDRLANGGLPETEGELNYAITMLLNDYLERKGKHYTAFNAAMGAMECAKQELYRRVIATYEDSKCESNGDVY